MEELKVLAGLVIHRLSNKVVLLQEGEQSTKEGLFVKALLSNNNFNDSDVSLKLYGSNPNDPKYKMLKYRLKNKLYNNLFFIDYNKIKFKIIYQKEQECIQLLHHANLLFRQDELSLATSLAKKILNVSQQYEFTNISISALEILLRCYFDSGNLKLYQSIDKKLRRLIEIKSYEAQAVSLYGLLRLQFKKSVKMRKNYMDILTDSLHKLEKLWNTAHTFETFNSYYKAYMMYYEMIGDFNGIIKLTVLSEKWLEENKINRLRFEANYNKFILVYAHLRAKKYAEGLYYAQQYLEVFMSNTFNRFAYNENYFLLTIHSKNYLLAESILSKILNDSGFEKLNQASKERWKLYSAYFGVVYPGNSFQSTINVNTNPYLLSLPEYSKDKQGFNVAILILQFIHFLRKHDVEALLYRIESLKKYINTHLKDTFSLRSKTFLKLLILTVTEDFDVEACKTKGEKLYQKLIDTPAPGDAFAEIEIVPYEHLWELILNIIKEK
ncbi:hypothetical protein [Pontibacter chitinilyticus]|uniref:hypothetical protein n=1 Tax=Pontibacter chitinilyticus TaxID=2674989 RepID=UPI003219A9DC